MAGKTATQLLVLWQSAVAAAGQGDSSRVHMMLYFREAFVWRIAEMTGLGTWSHFGDSAWTDEMIDTQHAPLVAEWRNNPRKMDEAR